MPAADLDIARQFQSAIEVGLRAGDFEPIVGLVTPDVECVMPVHTVYGIDALTEELRRGRPAESLEVEFENGEWKQLGNGRYSWETHVLFRSKATGELSYTRDRSFELTIRGEQVSRCEMRFGD